MSSHNLSSKQASILLSGASTVDPGRYVRMTTETMNWPVSKRRQESVADSFYVQCQIHESVVFKLKTGAFPFCCPKLMCDSHSMTAFCDCRTGPLRSSQKYIICSSCTVPHTSPSLPLVLSTACQQKVTSKNMFCYCISIIKWKEHSNIISLTLLFSDIFCIKRLISSLWK